MSYSAHGAGIAHQGQNGTVGKQRWDVRAGWQDNGHIAGKKMQRCLCTFWCHLKRVNAIDALICLCIHNKGVIIISPCGRMNHFNSTELHSVQYTCKNPIRTLLLFSHINSHSVPLYEQINCWSLNQITIHKLWKRNRIYFLCTVNSLDPFPWNFIVLCILFG